MLIYDQFLCAISVKTCVKIHKKSSRFLGSLLLARLTHPCPPRTEPDGQAKHYRLTTLAGIASTRRQLATRQPANRIRPALGLWKVSFIQPNR